MIEDSTKETKGKGAKYKSRQRCTVSSLAEEHIRSAGARTSSRRLNLIHETSARSRQAFDCIILSIAEAYKFQIKCDSCPAKKTYGFAPKAYCC